MVRVLLIVDDCEEICRGLRRCLKHHFDEIHTALTPEQAETCLALPEHAPTHLLCDYYLGERYPGGSELVRTWRKRYPSIIAAAIFSGSELRELPAGDGVDRVFRKPLEIDAIEAFFAPTPSAPPRFGP